MNYSTEESVGKGRKEWEISPADDRLSASHFLSAIQRMLSFSSTSKGPFSLFLCNILLSSVLPTQSSAHVYQMDRIAAA